MLTPRRTHACTWLLALGVSAGVLVSGSALAGEGPSEDASVQSSWRVAPPTLSLQPEAARLFLHVPPEWLPPPELHGLRPFEPDQRLRFTPEWRPAWNCASRGSGVLCTMGGPPLTLEVEDRLGSLGFSVTVLPRAAVAVLRFDPLPPWLR
jgi:hypothetical protein